MKRTMKTIPEALRPYEKCRERGAGELDDAELLAVMLKSGTAGKTAVDLAQELIMRAGGSLQGLYDLNMGEMRELSGIGDVKALQIMCLLELAKRLSQKDRDRKEVSFLSPDRIASYYMEAFRHKEQEELTALFLDAKGRRISDKMITRGSVRESLVPVREILVEALKAKAVQMVLLHNHPSGDPTPSGADILATREVRMAAALAGIPLLDHIIIGDHAYRSLKEEGLLE